ncbi:MAG: hypothetical protein ABI968_14020, partial [Acidobacteriota bacterium]
AVLGTTLLCFGLTEVFWSRTDIFPYHGPGFVAIALAWASYEAITTERLRWFVAAAALMALSYHQYPSGQTSFLIPVGAVLGRSLFVRGFVRRSWKGILVILVGAGLWSAGLGINGLLAGRPFAWRNPFGLNPGKTLWSVPLEHPGLGARAKFLAESAAKGVGIIIRTQFLEVVPSEFPHHENVPPVENLTRRHTSAPVAVLLALGLSALLLRPTRPASLVLLSWLLAGSLPGLLSTFPASRRLATLFPAYMAVAAVAGGLVLHAGARILGEKVGRVFVAVALGATFAGLGVVAGFLFLGPPRSPVRAVASADAIRPYLKPGTLAVLEAEYGEYAAMELTYLLLDQLSAGPRPASWRIANAADWPTLIFRPIPNLTSWIYTYTMLRSHAGALSKSPGFDRVTFLVQDTDARKRHRELLVQTYPGQELEHLKVSSSDDGRFNFTVMTVDTETLKDNQCPVVTLPGGSATEAGPADWWEGVKVRIRRDGGPSAPIAVSAGLWVPEMRRSALRIIGAGDGAALFLDGTPLAENEIRPLVRGIHRVDVTLGTAPRLPLRLEVALDGRTFEPVRSADVTSPRLASLPLLAPEPVLFYPGFDAPVPVVSLGTDFLSDLAVSPEGSIVAARGLREKLELELYPAGGGPSAVWSQPRPPGETPYHTSVSFVGDNEVALLSWPHLYIYDRKGKPRREIDLKPMMQGAEDLAANEEGEIFVVSASRRGVVVLAPDGHETALLRPKGTSDWQPGSLSAAHRGPVAVLDNEIRIRIFEKTPSGWEETRVRPGEYATGPNAYAIGVDGWLFSQNAGTEESLVFDRELTRRVVADPAQDLARYHPGNRFLGFDREGRLYTEANGRVVKFVPIADSPGSAARK